MGFFSGISSALTGGVLNLVGGTIANNSAKSAAKDADERNLLLSNTAHQREVADLMAAGLNPILSATGGSGASTPSAIVGPTNKAYSEAANSALSQVQKSKERQAIDATIAKTNADAGLSSAQTATAATQAALNTAAISKVKAETALTTNSALNSSINSELLRASLPEAKNEAQYQTDMGKSHPYIRNTLNFVKDLFGTANSAKSLTK